MEFELRSMCTLLVQLHQKKAHLTRATKGNKKIVYRKRNPLSRGDFAISLFALFL
ncbi:hypothetical protein XM77_c11514 [Vibrio vulnificus]|nr:hypothetical protein XM77_c11514 [Vibrio vulnificus]